MMYGISVGALVLLVLCVPAELVVGAMSVTRHDYSYIKPMFLILIFGVGCGFVSLATKLIADFIRDTAKGQL